MLTKKYFNYAAELVRNHPLGKRDALADVFATFFRNDNSRFDAARFQTACKTLRGAQRWMDHEVRYNRDDYLYCGELNATHLAEACAHALDLYEDDEDCSIPDELFTYAAELADKG